MQARDPITAGRFILDGFRFLFRPPFRMLLLLSVIVSLTSAGVGPGGGAPDQIEWILALGLLAVANYIQIAVTLAAGRPDPDPSADAWIKAAWRRRCFWRYVFTTVVQVGALLVGAAFFGIGLFIAGAIVALGEPAVALERHAPIQAVFRSAQLTKGSRVTSGVVFALLFMIPAIAIQLAVIAELDQKAGSFWTVATVATQILAIAGLIAITRMFVQLGGTPTPPLQEIAPPAPVEVP